MIQGFLGAQLLVGDIRIYRVARVMKQAHEKMKWKVPREENRRCRAHG